VPGFVGPWELIILALIVIAIFGTTRLPALGRQAGKATRKAAREVREVKQSLLVADERADKDETDAPPPKSEATPLTPKSALKRLVD
jgi:TatA/E family protein of Tat protein translocase